MIGTFNSERFVHITNYFSSSTLKNTKAIFSLKNKYIFTFVLKYLFSFWLLEIYKKDFEIFSD